MKQVPRRLVDHRAAGLLPALGTLIGGGGALGAHMIAGTIGAARLTLEGITALAGTAKNVALGAPVALGLGAGYIASRATSPTHADLATQEQRIVNARLKSATETNARRLAADLAERRDRLREG